MNDLANHINELIKGMLEETDIATHPETWAILCAPGVFPAEANRFNGSLGLSLDVVVDEDCPPDKLYIINKEYLPESARKE